MSTTSEGTTTITAIDATGKRATAAATLCEDGTWLANVEGMPAFMHEAATADEAIEGVRRAWEHVQRNRG